MKDQIALAGRAAKDHLYGINTAGIVFADTDDFLIIRLVFRQQFADKQGSLEADRKTGTFMSVKLPAFLP